MDTFDQRESQVRSYSRTFPTLFTKAKGPLLYDANGHQYIDFFIGAGVMSYGHNNPLINQAIIEYLQNDGLVHSLDLATHAKKNFLETFAELILAPRSLDYKIQFTGPTGTNAVEAALKLARRVTGRANVVSFTNAYHGLTLGALAHTADPAHRHPAYFNRLNATIMPFDGYLGPEVDTVGYLRRFLEDGSSGIDAPAAILVETIQSEGGVNVASSDWLRQLAQLCREFEIVLIVDDIQVGNGRTGDFFSFEASGITPDIVILSKAIGGGMPMSILLLNPKLDQWRPGEHNGTFRGNNLAFVAATAILSTYWQTDELSRAVHAKSTLLKTELEKIAHTFPSLQAAVRGRGLIYGLELPPPGLAKKVSQTAFQKGVIIELAGSRGQVLKFIPPLTIDEDTLLKGVRAIHESISEAQPT